MLLGQAGLRRLHCHARRRRRMRVAGGPHEAYLDVTENLKGITSGTRIAEVIRARIRAETGLTASAGVSYNKFLAKVASEIAEAGANIDSISMDDDRSLSTTMAFVLEGANRQPLARVMRSLRRLPDVKKIARVRE